MIPKFTDEGFLPVGIHQTGWNEIATRFGGNSHRKKLLMGLKKAMLSLNAAGCSKLFIDGSFVTSKEYPGDFDCCWDSTGVDPIKLNPVFLDFSNKRAAQKVKFGGEFFLSNRIADMSGKTYLEFFQKDKTTGLPKGIISLNIRGITI